MELLVYCIALFVTFIVLQCYIMLKTHSRAHRLLPLVMGLIAVYEFYIIVEYITGEHLSFFLLKKLLVLNFIYLMMNYFIEFMDFAWPKILDIIFFISLSFANGWMIHLAHQGKNFFTFYVVMGWVYLVTLLVVTGIVVFHYTIYKRSHTVSFMLYLGAFVPGIGLGIQHYFPGYEDLIMSIAFIFSCIIILYLILFDRLVDEKMFIQEEVYQESDLALVIVDAEGYIVDINKKAQEAFPNIIKREKERESAVGFKGTAKYYLEGPNTIEYENDERTYRLIKAPVYHRNHLKGYIFTIFDITDQKQQIVAYEEEKTRAQLESYKKNTFLVNMGHNLKTPLHAILGTSRVLLDERHILNTDRELILQMQQEGEYLHQLIDSMLDYASISSGELELNEEEYSLEELISETAMGLAVSIGTKDIEFNVHMHTDFCTQLIGDRIRIKEMLMRILYYPLTLLESGTLDLHIWSESISDTEEHLKMSVVDSGPGMDAAEIENLYVENAVRYRPDSPNEKYMIGLYSVREIAKIMGGDSYAISDGIKGNTVAIEFNQKVKDPSRSPGFLKSTEDYLMQNFLWQPKVKPAFVFPEAKILAVDDMQVNRSIVRELSKKWKITCEEAEDGYIAIEKAKAKDFDLIVLDLMMPGISGETVAAKIREFSDVPILALTADLSANPEILKTKFGINDVLYKPIDLKGFKKKIEHLLPKGKRSAVSDVPEKQQGLGEVTDYRKLLETYVSEVGPIIDDLPQIYVEDKDLFRVKVHGIKGITRQIGRKHAADMSEVMEMAIKASHLPYIESHMAEYQETILQVLDDIKKEIVLLEKIEGKFKGPEPEKVEAEESQIDEYFNRLKYGFEKYNMDIIEKYIVLLEKVTLSETDAKLLEQAIYYSREFDYEEGQAALSNR